jgi:ferrochelatase
MVAFVVYVQHMVETKNSNPKTAILLANLGTPEAPRRAAVARFLREFLSDPRVVDLPRYLWLPLLYLVIIPLRAGRSAAAYRKIWWPEGSPLLVLTQRLCDQLVLKLTGKAVIDVGMRYGKPSILKALERIRRSGASRLIVLPLYPQFSASTTSSIFDAVDQALTAMEWQPEIQRIEQYHDQAVWIEAVAASIRAYREMHGKAEKLILSMHGLPKRFVENGDPYEDQCRQSVESIVSALGLEPDEWLLTYQSRVGREPWLQPYTDISLQELAASGVKHVQVVCPGFAVDCLETLEEIAIQNRDRFVTAGGEKLEYIPAKLEYIPALNDSEQHADLLLELVNL